ncbi:hypothetical protein LPB72_07545 [Hydrogenophaga crassostreae]|uniref:Uncharacterized protein n=1 Tax=Hydrogenophaga crassostreae TaxID=1763535 RepID=A0A163CJG2_9BURK|nr:hypothetical protein LPB072_09825 [Hydrogenophaga crassostreae]OAD42750.1 hypothetical protein LPB72_07545 [Hydrogenophaga crassostreae]
MLTPTRKSPALTHPSNASTLNKDARLQQGNASGVRQAVKFATGSNSTSKADAPSTRIDFLFIMIKS